MNRKIILILALLVILALVLGCANKAAVQNRDKRQERTKGSVEDVLAKEISGGKLVDVYDEYVRVKQGKTSTNWMIINNVKDAGDTFTIQPCSGCQFESTNIDISTGKYRIIKFDVSAEAGQKEIRVKDSRNNAYGFAKISVIVE